MTSGDLSGDSFSEIGSRDCRPGRHKMWHLGRDSVVGKPAGGLLRFSRTWVQSGCGLMLGSGADLVEHAARDLH